jgi:hypothetical protein
MVAVGLYKERGKEGRADKAWNGEWRCRAYHEGGSVRAECESEGEKA